MHCSISCRSSPFDEDWETTMGGQRFREGELMIVDELRFSPAGIVWVGLRAIDGRHRMTGMLGEFVPANSRTR